MKKKVENSPIAAERIAQRRSLSQVFLQSEKPCEHLISQLQDEAVSHVIEIGPGSGILTGLLLKAGFKVTSIEFDSRFVELLKSKFHNDDLKIVCQNALDTDLSQYISPEEPTVLVGNIPYHISTPLVMHCLKYLNELGQIQFMVQDEFGQRICAHEGCKSYGSLSVYVQLRAQAHYVQHVPKELFRPIPKVDSAFIQLCPLDDAVPEALLRKVEILTRVTFGQRRKKLRNSLKSVVDKELLVDFPFDLERRPETLSPIEFLTMAKYLADCQS